jgi:hypothetical protein
MFCPIRRFVFRRFVLWRFLPLSFFTLTCRWTLASLGRSLNSPALAQLESYDSPALVSLGSQLYCMWL